MKRHIKHLCVLLMLSLVITLIPQPHAHAEYEVFEALNSGDTIFDNPVLSYIAFLNSLDADTFNYQVDAYKRGAGAFTLDSLKSYADKLMGNHDAQLVWAAFVEKGVFDILTEGDKAELIFFLEENGMWSEDYIPTSGEKEYAVLDPLYDESVPTMLTDTYYIDGCGGSIYADKTFIRELTKEIFDYHLPTHFHPSDAKKKSYTPTNGFNLLLHKDGSISRSGITPLNEYSYLFANEDVEKIYKLYGPDMFEEFVKSWQYDYGENYFSYVYPRLTDVVPAYYLDTTTKDGFYYMYITGILGLSPQSFKWIDPDGGSLYTRNAIPSKYIIPHSSLYNMRELSGTLYAYDDIDWKSFYKDFYNLNFDISGYPYDYLGKYGMTTLKSGTLADAYGRSSDRNKNNGNDNGSGNGGNGANGSDSGSGANGNGSGKGGAHKHSYTKNIIIAPSCEMTGVAVYTCSCGDAYEETIEATGHSYKEIGRIDATCDKEGEAFYLCENCGHRYTEVLPATTHVWEEVERVESTCTENGHVVYRCSVCGEEMEEELPLAPHNLIEVTRQDATCTEDGFIDFKCENCDHAETKILRKLEHDTEAHITKAPTWFHTGLADNVCKLCGNTISTDVLPKEKIPFWFFLAVIFGGAAIVFIIKKVKER